MGALSFPALDNAIAQFEGFGKSGTIATLQNNPGDLAYGNFASQHGAVGPGINNIAVFPSAATGTAAEDALVSEYANQGATIQDLISKWAPPNAPGNTPQSTQNYINFVTGQLGVSADTPVSSTGANSPAPGAGSSGPTASSITSSISNVLNPFSGFSPGRLGAFILGLILIAGGIYLFKPVQEVVNESVRSGVKAAALA